MSILPTGYKVPELPSKYMKFEFGENAFRILSMAIVGWEYWLEVPTDGGQTGRKPYRVKTYEDVPEEVKQATDRDRKARPFMAFKVFNYTDQAIQILELTQKSLMRGLQALDESTRWGDVRKYDLTVNKSKTGNNPTDVDYSIMPNPISDVDPEIVKLDKATYVNLDALWTGDDPFSQETANGRLTDQAIEDFGKSLGKVKKA